MVFKKSLGCMLACLCCYQATVFAADNVPTAIAKTSVQYLTSSMTPEDYQTLTIDQQQAIAARWNLSTADYDHYLWLMNNTINGVYYQDKHLDPSIILGFNANNDANRKKYALTAIKNEQTRVAKELALQNTFYQLQRELFPEQKPIHDPKLHHASNKMALQSGDVLLYFVDVAATAGDATTASLIKIVQHHTNIKLAIYISGQSTTDEAIRQWAADKGIPSSLVKENQISLNHEDISLQKLTAHPQTLPVLMLLRDNQVQPMDLVAIQ